MNIKYILTLSLLSTGIATAQQIPTGSPVPGTYTTAQQAASAWYRGGNNSGNTPGLSNLFGTAWNSPIYFITGGSSASSYRMKLNGDFSPFNQYQIDGYTTFGNTNITTNTSGYLLLGPDAPFQTQLTQTIYNDRGAYSLLHLNGSAPVQQNGYRPWMKTGITFTDNQDMSYFGLRQVGNILDYTETVLNWSDNAGILDDDMCFRFTGSSTSSTTIDQANLRNASDLDGLHIARFSANGRFGLGNTFGHTTAPGHPTNFYVRPQSLLHMSYDHQTGATNMPYGFMQITYRQNPGSPAIGTGETENDGLRFGIDNTVNTGGPQSYLNSYLRWQEASSFIIQTEDDNTPNISANERLRVTSIGALNSNHNTLFYDGLTATTNTTRVSISESGATPLMRPKSLLHIGYDYGGLLGIQGYRKWMDLGMLTSNQRDHVWIGLKPRDSIATTVTLTNDQLNAVVAWGTDRVATSPTLVDNMQFIFTGHPFDANPEGAPSTSYNGLEMMRIYPATVYNHPVFNSSGTQIGTEKSYGRVGVGDFTSSGVNGEPTQKLDVVGNGRFRYLPDPAFARDSTVDKFVMVDSAGVLRWGFAPKGLSCWDLNGNGIADPSEDINGDNQWNALDCKGDQGPAGPAGTSVGAHNGTSMSIIDPTKVSLGNDIGSTTGQFLSHREIPMNNFNMLLTTPTTLYNGNVNRLGIGTSTPSAKVDITMNPTAAYPLPIGLNISLNQAASNGQVIGQRMSIYGNNTTNTGGMISVTPGSSTTDGWQVQVAGSSPSGSSHRGVTSTSYVTGPANFNIAVSGGAGNGRFNYGGGFTASGVAGSQRNIGVQSEANGVGSSENIGVLSQVGGTGTGNNYGVWTQVLVNSGLNMGVLSSVNNSTNPSNRAGYFVGQLETTAASVITSDSIFKTNVGSLEGSLKLLQTVKPVSYYMDTTGYEQFNFESRKQYGFIAQQLERVYPNLVHKSTFPAQYDSLGNETSPAVEYKSVNYTAMIPVNTQALIELNHKVDAISLSDQSIKTNVQNLTGSLDKVLDMHGVSYDWDHTVHPELNLDSLNQIGFIAQEIQVIDPRLTFVADDSLLHVKYEKVVPILAEAIEELNGQVESKDSIINVLITENSTQQTTIDAQQTTINDLNNRLTQLENCLSGILPYLCQLSHSAIQANTPEAQEEVRKNLNVTLSNRNAIVLDQNVPNPFAEQTVINFSIPESVKKAQIHFYDGTGRFMNSVEVIERGLGSITVFGSDLSTGVYTYNLVADGQVVATKKMMKQ